PLPELASVALRASCNRRADGAEHDEAGSDGRCMRRLLRRGGACRDARLALRRARAALALGAAARHDLDVECGPQSIGAFRQVIAGVDVLAVTEELAIGLVAVDLAAALQRCLA